MLNRVFEFSLGNRFLILIFTALIVGLGIYSLQQIPIDAVPDVTPNQVQILTNTPDLGPVEVEQFVTFPIETAMSGLPGIERIRSISRFGFSVATVYFRENMDIYFCRRLVMERLPAAKELIPAGFGTPRWGRFRLASARFTSSRYGAMATR
jgi:heavy metal efflux system protein